MPYTTAAKKLAKEYVDALRSKTFCSNCGSQPIEYHNEEHELNSNRRVAHLVALGFPLWRIDAEIGFAKLYVVHAT